MDNLKLEVRSIIGDEVNGYSRVIVSKEIFLATKGANPSLPYKSMGDKDGKLIRAYTIEDTKLYVKYDDGNSVFIMSTEDAKRCLGLSLLPFSTSMFDVKDEEAVVANA